MRFEVVCSENLKRYGKGIWCLDVQNEPHKIERRGVGWGEWLVLYVKRLCPFVCYSLLIIYGPNNLQTMHPHLPILFIFPLVYLSISEMISCLCVSICPLFHLSSHLVCPASLSSKFNSGQAKKWDLNPLHNCQSLSDAKKCFNGNLFKKMLKDCAKCYWTNNYIWNSDVKFLECTSFWSDTFLIGLDKQCWDWVHFMMFV